MRILLINTNRAMQPYPVMPIGMASVATALKRQGHAVRVLDLCFSTDVAGGIRAAVAEADPQLVGLSVRNLDNSDLMAFHWFLPEIREMVREIRGRTDAPIVAGGSAISVMPVEALEYLECDLGVIGDGEAPIIALARALERGDAPAAVPGVVSRDDGRWTVNPRQPVEDYGLYGTTQLHRWVDVREYVRRGAIFPVQSNRGCAFSCIYCTYTLIEGKQYRLRPADLVVQELQEARRSAGVDFFEFVDSVFNVPEKHARAVCQAIAAAGVRARFGAAGINPRWLTPELLRDMQDAGFGALEVTIESASEAMLRAMNKGFRRADVLRAAERVGRTRLSVLWVLLVGGPGETPQTLEESFAFVRERVRPSDVVYITAGLRIYPDTPLAAAALEEGRIRSARELLRPVFYLSESVGLERMRDAVLGLVRERSNVIASFDADDPWLPRAYRWMDRLRVPQPYWRYTPWLNRVRRWLPRRRLLGRMRENFG